jgi:UDP-N-acetylglucosamine 1-carboxyvinyltransferase
LQKIVINGGKRLHGEVRVSGSKNAALPILASALLARGRSTYRNVPALGDVRTMGRLLARLGAEVDGRGKGVTRIDTTDAAVTRRPTIWSRRCAPPCWCSGRWSRAAGRARVSLPGGCAIGARPIDQHLKGLEAMGARIELARGYVNASGAPAARRQHRVRHGTVTGHGEPDDGRGAGARAHDAGECGA